MRSVLQEPRILTGIALMCIATVLGGIVMQRATQRTPVWSIDHALAAGTVLSAADVHVAEVALPDVGPYVPAARRIVGRTLARDVAAGELLPYRAFGGRTGDDAVALQNEHLHVANNIVRGARVDVWWTVGDGQRLPMRTTRVLQRVPVLSITTSNLGGRDLVLGVPRTQVQGFVLAMRSGAIDVVGVQ
mgnify:CR=1 FL=1